MAQGKADAVPFPLSRKRSQLFLRTGKRRTVQEEAAFILIRFRKAQAEAHGCAFKEAMQEAKPTNLSIRAMTFHPFITVVLNIDKLWIRMGIINQLHLFTSL